MKKIFITTAILLTLTACASDRPKHHRVNIEDNLAKEITQDQTKLFTYTMKMSFKGGRRMRQSEGYGGGGMEGGMGRGGMGGGSGGGEINGGMERQNRGMRDPEAMKQRMENRILQRLSEKIKDSGYCREGYKILDKDIERGYASIRGQCNEKANEEDIRKYESDKHSG